MLKRIIKNLSFSGILVGLIGMMTGLMFVITGQNSQATFYFWIGFLLFIISLFVAAYLHHKNIHVEQWAFFLGLTIAIILFVLEAIFFSFSFALGIIVAMIIIVFIYVFIVRTVRQIQRKK
jgi:uncharacterized membrane protein